MAAVEITNSAAASLRKGGARLRSRLKRQSTNPDSAIPAGYDASAGLGFDDHSLESRLTWIWGSPRSGSTWLLKMLGYPLDPDPETALGFHPPAKQAGAPFDAIPVDETFISNHISPALADPLLVDGRWVPGTLRNYLAAKPAYVLSDEFESVWRPELRRLALVRLNSILERSRNAGIQLGPEPEVVIKETNGSHAADLVMSILPGSRLLLLIRDGRDVVDSLLDAYKPGAFMANNQRQSFGTAEERAERLRWAARLWASNVDTTLTAMETHPAELTRVVRYEDLLADPVGEMSALYSWLGLARDSAWVERMAEEHRFSKLSDSETGPLTRNRAAQPGLWREKLSADEQAAVAEIVGARLERFSYEP